MKNYQRKKKNIQEKLPPKENQNLLKAHIKEKILLYHHTLLSDIREMKILKPEF